MYYYQIRFQVINPDFMDEDHSNIYGGIGEYALHNGREQLVSVICGCCGSTFEPDDIKVLDKYDTWLDLTETIVGD